MPVSNGVSFPGSTVFVIASAIKSPADVPPTSELSMPLLIAG